MKNIMTTNAVLHAVETPERYYRDTPVVSRSASYVRKNFEMAQAVYRAQIIQGVAGAGAARLFLSCAGADAALIERIVSRAPSNLRR
ncbi:hypothetical protein [Massilia sp. GCM10023247]|uniref:hypothetical protein n=1 Tax=Massilia sp. GCM10023247 TaxID=3252643 RepID=UPI0036240565